MSNTWTQDELTQVARWLTAGLVRNAYNWARVGELAYSLQHIAARLAGLSEPGAPGMYNDASIQAAVGAYRRAMVLHPGSVMCYSCGGKTARTPDNHPQGWWCRHCDLLQPIAILEPS